MVTSRPEKSAAKRDDSRPQRAGTTRKSGEKGTEKQKKHCHRVVAVQSVKKNLFSLTYDDMSKYVGEIHVDSNQRNGKGVFQTKQGDIMDGQWKDDRFHGFGTRIFAQTGDRHEGMYYKDKRHGRGTYLWKNGDKFVGDFYNGRMHGSGIFLSANGDVFEGTWLKGTITGGTKTLPNGDKIQGDDASVWRDGFLTGNGVKYFRNGDEYRGHFDSNILSGYGTYRWANGDVYQGMWACNQMQGIGRFETTSIYTTAGSSRRDVYYGEFVKGQYHGQGRIEYANGAIYEGAFMANLRHGRGVYRWIDGEMYQGTWEQNLPSGMGFHLCDHFTYHGSWKEGYPHGMGVYACRQTAATKRHTFEFGRAIDDASLVLERLCVL